MKAKISKIDPAKDLVDVWRLFRSSVIHEKFEHPSLQETHESDLQAYLNRYMLTNPTFFGLIARIGKRPVAQVFGHLQVHPIGMPGHYFFVHNVWVEPEFRGKKLMTDLWEMFLSELKSKGIFHWEANVFSKLADRLLKAKGLGVRKLSTRVGGRI